LIDLAVAAVGKHSDLAQGHWVDLGTGSGAIAIALAHAFPHAQIHAVDISKAALAIARENAQRWAGDRVQFYQGNWFEPLSDLKGQLNGMVSNPPYIPRALVPTLQPEVANHEPHLALDGGADGLEWVRQLISQAPAYLRSEGIWLVELMAGQADQVMELLRQQGVYQQIRSYRDLAGIDRFVLARRR
jgi:release factor glutamine methyltransferase